jgi:hypothetical protein
MTKTLARKIEAYCKKNMSWWDYDEGMGCEHVPAKQVLKELNEHFGTDLADDIRASLILEIEKERRKARKETEKALEGARKNARYGIRMYGEWIYFTTMKEAVAWALDGLLGTEGAERDRYAYALGCLKEGWNFINTDVAC